MDALSPSDRIDGYQPNHRAWDPFRGDIISLLSRARHRDLAPIYFGSNHCFLVTLETAEGEQSLAVYKPARGEYPLYDFPNGTLYRREVASWLVDDLLGWNVIPPTVVTQGKFGVGSLQLFIESGDATELSLDELQRLALIDIVLNNADRKSDHCLLDMDGKLWGIDHGLTFHTHPKLRTIIWHFAGTPLASDTVRDLERLRAAVEQMNDPRARQLKDLISNPEWRALRERVARLLSAGVYPDPRYKPVPYRW